MNKPSLILFFVAALCSVGISSADDTQATSAIVAKTYEFDYEEVIPTQEKAVEIAEASYTQEQPELTVDEEQELERLLYEFIQAQQEQEKVLADQK